MVALVLVTLAACGTIGGPPSGISGTILVRPALERSRQDQEAGDPALKARLANLRLPPSPGARKEPGAS